MSLNTTVKSIQDIMRKDVGVDGDAQRIGQLVWLLFLKIWDDREQEAALFIDDFVSPLAAVPWLDADNNRRTSDVRWSTWAAPKGPDGEPLDKTMTGDDLIAFVEGEVFPALQSIELGPDIADDDERPAAVAARRLRRQRALIQGLFQDAYQYMKSGILLRQVIDRIEQDIDFNDAESRHLFGDIYEKLLKDLQSAGNAGEYYTPRAVTRFAVDMIDPRLGETVLDPACGTGGFLACAIEHIRQHQVTTPEHEAQLQGTIRGIEKKPLPHLLCVTNLFVHGIDVPDEVRRDNALNRPLRDISARDRVDVVLTNPPFGGMEEDGIESNFPRRFQTRETADLFLVLIVELLKTGGRAAVVLPDGTLFGEGVKTRIKEHLMTVCDLHTIVRLPKGVFAPYTSINTNVLFFEKGRPTETVWFYEHPYPEGYASYSKTRPMRIEEFAPEKEWWRDRKETPHAWKWDFAADLRTARGRAQPHWDAAETAEREARRLKERRTALKAERRAAADTDTAALDEQIAETETALEAASRRARAEKAAGDALYDAVFNLDRKNPNAPEATHEDPDVLLDRFVRARAEAVKVRDALKAALAAALEGRE